MRLVPILKVTHIERAGVVDGTPVIARQLFRGFAVWLILALAEMVHGTLRTLYLVPRVGDLASRQIGVFTGSLIIVLIACATIRWIGTGDTRSLLRIGLLWLILMLTFEVTLGRTFGMSWDRILSDYLPWRGGFMLFGMLVLALSPLLARRLRDRFVTGNHHARS